MKESDVLIAQEEIEALEMIRGKTQPLDRPSINKVIEMLPASIEALHVPPNPSLFSPPTYTPKVVTGSSTISIS
ncbi:hypothetical protein Dsin_005148 [Dipteronia sinensis]|uniref:Uncharacterized protein n=1 Tax=Dipteronia sinensis TaxID=43782 RepID=A0AAE0AVZ4_9ROSI|nr:hypothetical protein Dsin_005148 [Dipteronia sinensis]